MCLFMNLPTENNYFFHARGHRGLFYVLYMETTDPQKYKQSKTLNYVPVNTGTCILRVFSVLIDPPSHCHVFQFLGISKC